MRNGACYSAGVSSRWEFRIDQIDRESVQPLVCSPSAVDFSFEVHFFRVEVGGAKGGRFAPADVEK